MDDARIRELTAEVLRKLRGASDSPEVRDLEQRVASLEAALGRVSGAEAEAEPTAAAPAVTVHVHLHPSQQVLNVVGANPGDRCVLEPDKPCVASGQCRTLGH